VCEEEEEEEEEIVEEEEDEDEEEGSDEEEKGLLSFDVFGQPPLNQRTNPSDVVLQLSLFQ